MGIQYFITEISTTTRKCTHSSLYCFWLLPTLMKESSMELMLLQLPLLHGKYPFSKVVATSAEELSSQPPMLCLLVTAKSTTSFQDSLLLWEVLTTQTWTNNSPCPAGLSIHNSPKPTESTTITLSSPSPQPSPSAQELLKPLPSQLLAKNSAETPSSPDGERPRELASEATPSQPPSNGLNFQSLKIQSANPSGEELASPHNLSVSEAHLLVLVPATETLVAQWSKLTPTASPGSSETPHGEHHHATPPATQPSTPRTQLLLTGSNNNCKLILLAIFLYYIERK